MLVFNPHIEKGTEMLKEFKEFAVKGNMVDMAVGIIIGAAFGTIVSTLVADVITPFFSLLMNGVDFTNMHYVLKEGAKAPVPYLTLKAAADAGAITLNYGKFLNAIISFLMVAFTLFIVIKQINKLKKEEEAKPAAAPPANEVLLAEIRDLLKK